MKARRAAGTGGAKVGSVQVDPERLARLWRMGAAERLAMAQQGKLTLGEMLAWAGRAPREVPLVNGEFFFLMGHPVPHRPRAPARRAVNDLSRESRP